MKTLIVKPALALGLFCIIFGCTKNSIEDVFSGVNSDAISSVELSKVLDVETLSLLESNNGLVVTSILKKIDKESKFHQTDCAYIVNESDVLRDIYDNNGKLIDFSCVDFDNYSVVVGVHYFVDHSFLINDMKVVVKEKQIKLFTEVVKGGPVYHQPNCVFFMSVFPKLPDYDIEMIRWNHFE